MKPRLAGAVRGHSSLKECKEKVPSLRYRSERSKPFQHHPKWGRRYISVSFFFSRKTRFVGSGYSLRAGPDCLSRPSSTIAHGVLGSTDATLRPLPLQHTHAPHCRQSAAVYPSRILGGGRQPAQPAHGGTEVLQILHSPHAIFERACYFLTALSPKFFPLQKYRSIPSKQAWNGMKCGWILSFFVCHSRRPNPSRRGVCSCDGTNTYT